jgi:hypothetical protein
MAGLLQVGISRPDGGYVTDNDEREKALQGSPYTLDRQQTELNDNIAMVTTPTESAAMALMEAGKATLPSGYTMEVPTA